MCSCVEVKSLFEYYVNKATKAVEKLASEVCVKQMVR